MAFVFAACAPAAPTPTIAPPASLWGEIITVGRAEQVNAPAMWVDNTRITLMWIGSDETSVHHDIRILGEMGLSPKVEWPLSLVHPFAQQIAPSFTGGTHILWLDAAPDTVDSPAGELRLYTALTLPDMELDRGAIAVSNRRTLRYAFAPAEGGGLWVVWSGGLLSEPELTVQHIDAAGRPRYPETLVYDADWPAMVNANDSTIHLFWLNLSEQRIYRAQLVEGVAEELQPFVDAPTMNTGDRLMTFSASLDTTHGYLFWNVACADGTPETWLATGLLEANRWDSPERFTVPVSGTSAIETGFNSGAVMAAEGEAVLGAWAAPLRGQNPILPVAVNIGEFIGIAYLRGGEVIGYQRIAESGRLIGAPALATDRNRHLYLAWSQPTDAGDSELNLTMTKR